MRFRDMIRLRIARTAPDKPARRGRTGGHGIEPLEGRQPLSGLPASVPRPETPVWPIAVVNDPSGDADRPVLIAKIVVASQDVSLAAILSTSTGTSTLSTSTGISTSIGITPPPPVTDARGAVVIAARGVELGDPGAALSPAEPSSFGGGWGTNELPGHAFAVEARFGTPPGPPGWAAFLLDRASLQGTIDLASLLAAFRDPAPSPGLIHSDDSDGLPGRDPNDDLDVVSDDPTTSATVAIEPGREELGAPTVPEGIVTVPVAGPGTVPGLLDELAGRGGRAPLAVESPSSLGLGGDDLPRDGADHASTEAARGPNAMDDDDNASIIEVTIADVAATLSRGADLFASFSPFDRLVLEHTIDRFLGEVGDLGAVFSSLDVKATLIPNLAAAAGSIAVFEAVRRRLRGRSGEEVEDSEGDGDASPPGLPGLPRGWGMEEL